VILLLKETFKTKKTFSPKFTQSLLCLVLLVVLFGNFVNTTYDGLVRPTQKASQGNTINYYYDPEVEFLELDHSINGSRFWNLYGPDRSGVYGGAQGIGGLECTYNETSGTTYDHVKNFFGDTVGIYTDKAANLYDSVLGGYGPMPGSSVNGNLQSQWRGHYLDPTGFISMGARYYDPQSGRFISPDPLGHGASMSLYDYCNGDPVNALDPDGRCAEWANNNNVGTRINGAASGWLGCFRCCRSLYSSWWH
jgi:RHS repeat-associated protein